MKKTWQEVIFCFWLNFSQLTVPKKQGKCYIKQKESYLMGIPEQCFFQNKLKSCQLDKKYPFLEKVKLKCSAKKFNWWSKFNLVPFMSTINFPTKLILMLYIVHLNSPTLLILHVRFNITCNMSVELSLIVCGPMCQMP